MKSAPYSLLRYNSGNFGAEIAAEQTFTASLDAVAGPVVPIDSAAYLTGTLRGTFYGMRIRDDPERKHGSHYSLLRYSVNPWTVDFQAEQDFSASLHAVAGAAIPVGEPAYFTGSFFGKVRGSAAIQSTCTAAEKLTAHVEISADILSAAFLEEALNSRASGSQNSWIAAVFQGALSAPCYGSKDMYRDVVVRDALQSAAFGSKNIYSEAFPSEVLTALAGGVKQVTKTASFSVTIPPGSELRINSELFTVTLDGENILYTQTGDWIKVSRELSRLGVESASGSLEGTLIYTERYL